MPQQQMARETPYSLAWKEFLTSWQYVRANKELLEKGLQQDYINDVFRISFNAAWLTKTKK